MAIVAFMFVLSTAFFPGLLGAAPGKEKMEHPKVTLLDKDGKPVPIIPPGKAKPQAPPSPANVDFDVTCGQCHDTHYIKAHNSHTKPYFNENCTVCHFKEGNATGDPSEVHLQIQMPSNRNCAACHGLVQLCTDPLIIPDDYPRQLYNYLLTQNTGAIYSPQDLSQSALNLKNKEELHFPWDAHAMRQMTCVNCHSAGNDVFFDENNPAALTHLTRDPRKSKSPGEILKRPDHMLKKASCTSCHDPFKVHAFLPYKKRHLDVLSCQSCHVPRLYGPAFQTVDDTVVTVSGNPRVEYRGVDPVTNFETAVSAQYTEGYEPYLLPHRPAPSQNRQQGTGTGTGTGTVTDLGPAAGPVKISPFNLVTHFYWKSKKTEKRVKRDTLLQVYLDNGQYAADILKVFDKNKNKVMDGEELLLDSEEKINAVKSKLQVLGIEEPVIAGTVRPYSANHNVLDTPHMTRGCSPCHGAGSQLGREIVLSRFIPAGIIPELSTNGLVLTGRDIAVDGSGRLVLTKGDSASGRYVFGHSRVRLLDLLGLWIFIVVILGILVHGVLRYVFSLKHPLHKPETEQIYMYGFYERLWHWTMAVAVLILALTGLEIHYTGGFTFFGLSLAVSLHNILAVILVLNAALSLFYHLASGEIRQYFGFNRVFMKEVVLQVYYYLYGIFRGHPHPVEKSVERKLNPLQQLAYIFLLNILMPFQVITGMMIWGAERWEFVSRSLGGLSLIAPIHNFGSWLFLAFVALHIYLTTTGHTVFSSIRAMITGFDEVPRSEALKSHRYMMDMNMIDLVGTIIRKAKEK